MGSERTPEPSEPELQAADEEAPEPELPVIDEDGVVHLTRTTNKGG